MPLGTQSKIPLIKLPSNVIEKCSNYWINTLVDYFVENQLPFSVVQSIAKHMCQRHGLLEVLSNNWSFFFFHFDSQENILKVFDAGPYHFCRPPIYFKMLGKGYESS